MSVLNVERPDFMAEEDIRMFEDSVTKFFQQHAPAERSRIPAWPGSHQSRARSTVAATVPPTLATASAFQGR